MTENTQIGALSPTLAEVIVKAIEARIFDLHTGLPARVLSYDPDSQSAEVQPLLNRVFLNADQELETLEIPPLKNVPVQYPAGNGWHISYRLAAGDVVYLTFAERSLDKWLDTAGVLTVDPADSRKHDLSDAIAIPGIRTRSAAVPDPGDDLVLGKEDGSIEVRLSPTQIAVNAGGTTIIVRDDGTVDLGDGATQAAVLGDALDTWLTTSLTVSTAFGPSGPSTIPLSSSELSGSVKVKG